jgi:hypothetical protein
VVRDYAVQVSPQPVYVGRTQAIDPLCTLCRAVVATLSGHRSLTAGSEVCFFRIFTNGFHRIVRVGPTLFGSSIVTEIWRVLVFDRGCLETPGVRQIARTARDDEGMIAVL